jgi:hypothetical protein
MLGQKSLPVIALSCFFLSLAVAADAKTGQTNLTVAQIVESHVAARGGLQAWRAVQTMSLTGKMEAGSGDSVTRSTRFVQETLSRSSKMELPDNKDSQEQGDKQVRLPFKLEMKRGHKSRLEIEFAGKTAVQVYDGTNGWKLRPFLNRNDVQPFTSEEAKSEAAKADLDGPLVDYTAKGTKLELEGVEPVEGHPAYKLKLTLKSGDVQHVWIDAQSFLDVKIEGTPRRMDGHIRNVWVYQRDFRAVQGLQVPYVLETAVEGYNDKRRILIQSVVVNSRMDDALFTKPSAK